MLHHVAVRDIRKGLFLVGNTKKIMFGIFVTYSNALVETYRSILVDLYDRGLAPFYGNVNDLPQRKIENVLATKEMKKIGLSVHSFQTNYYIWRSL